VRPKPVTRKLSDVVTNAAGGNTAPITQSSASSGTTKQAAITCALAPHQISIRKPMGARVGTPSARSRWLTICSSAGPLSGGASARDSNTLPNSANVVSSQLPRLAPAWESQLAESPEMARAAQGWTTPIDSQPPSVTSTPSTATGTNANGQVAG